MIGWRHPMRRRDGKRHRWRSIAVVHHHRRRRPRGRRSPSARTMFTSHVPVVGGRVLIVVGVPRRGGRLGGGEVDNFRRVLIVAWVRAPIIVALTLALRAPRAAEGPWRG